MSGKGYDPSSWAKQRQAAIARAQAIRAERSKGEDITEEHTFTPNTTPYPTYLKKASSNRAASATSNGDSLDQLATQMSSPPRHLHTQHGPGAQISAVHNPHSPNDALSKHVKSMSLQELADANPDDLDAGNGSQDEAHATFASLLRSDDPMPSKARTQQVRTKPDWNTSTEPSGWGTDTYVRPSASAQRAAAAPRLAQTTKPKADNQDIRQARSRLSLLKSKMARQSSEENVLGDQTRRQLPQSQTPFVDSSVFINFDADAPAPAASSAPQPRARRTPGEQLTRPPRQPAASKQADAVMPPSSTWDELPPPPRSTGRRPALQGSTAGMNQPEEYPTARATEGMNECPDCGRKFNAQAFEKHVKICQKVFMSKRKVFDTQKMRVADTEAAKFIAQDNRRNPRGGAAATIRQPAIPAASKRQQALPPDERPLGGKAKQSKWRQQSEQFREAIRQARKYQQAKEQGVPMSALPPPVPSAPDPSLIPCPHCGRRFNETAAERHIPQCKNIKAKPSRLVRGGGVNAASGRTAAEAKSAKRR